MYRQMYQTAGVYQQPYGKSMQYPLVGPNNYGFVQAPSLQHQQLFYNASAGQYGPQRTQKGQMMPANVGQKVQRGPNAGFQKGNGYQLKVGGVVVGSWANGSRNIQAARMNRTGMVKILKCFIFNSIKIAFSDSLSSKSAQCPATS